MLIRFFSPARSQTQGAACVPPPAEPNREAALQFGRDWEQHALSSVTTRKGLAASRFGFVGGGTHAAPWGVIAIATFLFTSLAIAQEAPLSVLADPMTGGPQVVMEKGTPSIVAEGPAGAKVTRFDDAFAGRIDLAPRSIDPHKFELIKVEVKADRGAFLRFSLENFPQPGQLSHWYVLDTARGAFGWRTIWIDLNKPEEIKAAGTYKGMGESDPAARGLRFDGLVKDLKRAAQGPGRSIWVGPVRFCRKAVDVDWDQTTFSQKWVKGDLLYTYPVTVTNKLDRPVTAALRLLPFRADATPGAASATLSSSQISLAAGEKKTVEATISLPATAAGKAEPLYAEPFEVRAFAEGIDDSEVTILRSSDPIHLPVVVPVAEEKLTFPLVPHKGMERGRYNAATARTAAAAVSPDDLNTGIGGPLGTEEAHEGFYPWAKKPAWVEAVSRYLNGATACAFLYDESGEKQYLEKGTALLVRAAELYGPRQEQWRRLPYSPISHGVFAEGSLRMGWATGGMRPVYSYDRHGLFNDFDLLAPGMDSATRQKIIRDFIHPAGVHMRNHFFGLTNQQDVVNYAILYAGLAARNWPLAAFAVNSEHGVRGQLQWGFTDDGLAGEVNYHGPALDGITWTAELLQRVGVNLYDARLYECLHSRAAAALGKPYNDPIVAFLDQNRFTPAQRAVAATPTDGVHLASGMTLLKWKGTEVCMNWGEQLNRNACDRCALQISTGRGDRGTVIGGGNYSHSSLGQSIIIIDEELQNPVPATVTGVDVTGPVQFVQATSDQHYPGVAITRTFALVGPHVLAIDRVVSGDGKPHLVDWCLRFRGGVFTHTALADGLDLPMKIVTSSFTAKPSDRTKGADYGAQLRSPGHLIARTVAPWRQSTARLLMAGGPATEVMAFAVPAAYSAWKKEAETGVPVLMARRTGVKETDYLAAFSPEVKSIERQSVITAGGKPANAVGLQVLLNDGTSFRAIVNYEAAGAEVTLGDLKTTERFATDFR
jgi:hypothetical protein